MSRIRLHHVATAKMAGGKKQRLCLSCGDMFASEGKYNRLCSKCRNRDAYTHGK